MGCCNNHGEHTGNSSYANSAFIILVLYILLAIILGGILF